MVQFHGQAGDTLLCSLARHVTLTLRQVYSGDERWEGEV